MGLGTGVLHHRFGDAVGGPLDGQDAGQAQLVGFPGQEGHGLKAGLGLRRAAGEGGIVVQPIVIRQVPEGEAVGKEKGAVDGPVCGGLVLPVQVGQLLAIGIGVGLIGVPVGRVDGAQGVRNGPAEGAGVLEGEPDVLVGVVVVLLVVLVGLFGLVSVVVCVFLVVFVVVAVVVVILVVVVIFVVVVVMVVFLHPLHIFYAVSQYLHQVQGDPVGVAGVGQGVLHPGVRFAAGIEKQVAIGDGDHVVRRGLEAVQVHAVVQEHGQLHPVGLVAQNLPDPVILRENGGDDAQLVVGLFGGGRGSAAGQKSCGDQQGEQDGTKFFHNNKTSEI